MNEELENLTFGNLITENENISLGNLCKRYRFKLKDLLIHIDRHAPYLYERYKRQPREVELLIRGYAVSPKGKMFL